LFSIFIIADGSEAVKKLHSGLAQNGFACSIAFDGNEVIAQVAKQDPDLVLVEVDGHLANSGIRELCQRIKRERHLPIIALVCMETLDSVDSHLDIDDFVITPCDVTELVLRIKRLLYRISNTDSGELIRCGDLVIDLAKCEVTLEGKLVVLTFREYELLKFLANNRGRVFAREALLNKVWGYDYYGGDRTIDVHIRRLRSKIEDSSHTFIETVRNIGYRFREEA
jgi:DNA-binding response OmpR family regulator